jgi:Uncharacterised nucleotidyltransferase
VSANGRLIHEDVVEETMRLLAAAQAAQVPIRLLGGMAIVLHVGELLHPAFRREIRDIDLATPKRDGRKVADFLTTQGYEPNKTFNAMHGARRLLFYDDPNERQIDVFVGSFEMCHQLPLEERLELEPVTLPLAELVLTKLQIVKLNQKDAYDLYSVLLTHEVSDGDSETINAKRIAQLCAADWGLYRTVQLNIERLRSEFEVPELSGAQMQQILDRLRELEDAIERMPKTTKWKLRARVGDRVRWYEDPDEVEKGAY